MSFKKTISILMTAVMVLSLTACGGSKKSASSSASATPEAAATQAATTAPTAAATGAATSTGAKDLGGISLEVAVTYTGAPLETFKKVVADFEKEYNCKIELDAYGDDYETTLKTRMASNELPDIWQTHGWSILRYKDYLMNLNDQDWVKLYDDSALGVIKDSDGAIYVLMISELVNGTLCNLDVCQKAGVDPYAIHTWDDFTAACAKIKAAGYTAICNTINPGDLANISGTWYSYTGEKYQLSDSMLNGKFDWSVYGDELGYWAKWIDAGYCFDDVQTVTDTDTQERWAADKAAFYLGNDPSFLISAHTLNANGNYAFLPTFASTADGTTFCGVGEGDAFGIWKDTKKADAAKAFLEYLTRADVANTINTANGKIGAISTAIEADKSYGEALFTTMQQKCSNVFYENLWDRKYMPSGMWDIFGTAASQLFADHSEKGIKSVESYLSENYTDLYEAAKSGK